MAVPKQKVSRSRRDKRRTHKGLSPAASAACPQCSQEKLSHRVCPHCGYYKGRLMVITTPKEKEAKK